MEGGEALQAMFESIGKGGGKTRNAIEPVS